MDPFPQFVPNQTQLRAAKPGRLPGRLLMPDEPRPMAYAGPGDDELPATVSAVNGAEMPNGTVTGA